MDEIEKRVYKPFRLKVKAILWPKDLVHNQQAPKKGEKKPKKNKRKEKKEKNSDRLFASGRIDSPDGITNDDVDDEGLFIYI